MKNEYSDFRVILDKELESLYKFKKSKPKNYILSIRTHKSLLGYTQNSNMPRGYYCPNPMLETIIHGYKRGRLVKKKPNKPKYQVYYGHDQPDEIRFYSNDISGNSKLFNVMHIDHYEDCSIGYNYFSDGLLMEIDRALYDESGRIIRYSVASNIGDILHPLSFTSFNYAETGYISDITYIERGKLIIVFHFYTKNKKLYFVSDSSLL